MCIDFCWRRKEPLQEVIWKKYEGEQTKSYSDLKIKSRERQKVLGSGLLCCGLITDVTVKSREGNKKLKRKEYVDWEIGVYA